MIQQGDRLENYRQKDMFKIFKPAYFNVLLLDVEREKFVKGRFGSGFTFSLVNNSDQLQPGEYIIMLDPYWEYKQEPPKQDAS